jgi:hypothetical protein
MTSIEKYMTMTVDELKSHLTFLAQSYIDTVTYSYMAKNPMAARSLALQGEVLKKDLDQCRRVYNMRLKQLDIEGDFDELD